MPQDVAIAEFNTFVQGLITEASPLIFPENAALDIQNVVLNREGSFQRRLGIDYESDYYFNTTPYSNADFQSNDVRVDFYRWDNVANDPGLSFGVVRVGSRLWFLDLTTSNPSANLRGGGFRSISGLDNSATVQFSPIGGKLAMTVGRDYYRLFEYRKDSDSFADSILNFNVRDIWGVDDGLDADERPSSLSNNHHYNLLNQGWPLREYRDTDSNFRQPHDHYKVQRGTYPSNADIWYFGQQPDGSLFKFEAGTIEAQWFGNTPAPKGHFVINLFERSSKRGGASRVVTSTDITYGSANTIATFAGRVFISGFEVSDEETISTSPRLSTMIIFSQLADNDDKLERFYQESDPTEQEGVGLVDTDGGTITIPEASRIYKLIPTGRSLVVIAENGVWSISGSEEGFSAKNFQVSKISNIGAINADSVVEAEGVVYYLSKAGVYSLQPDKVTGELSPLNISENTIQTAYINIPSIGRSFARAFYDEAAREVKWLFNDQDTYDGLTYVNRYNKELILDISLGAFYINKIPSSTTTPSICAYVSIPNYLSVDDVTNIVVGADNVVVGSDDVTITKSVRSRGTSATKYLTIRQGTSDVEFSLSEYRNSDFLDWYTEDSVGVDADAYLEAGYLTGGDSQREKAAKYLIVHCKRTETGYEVDGSGNIVFNNPSSCLVQGRWDFTDSTNSGKWSDQFEAYRLNKLYIPSGAGDPFDYGYDIVTSKSKLRGDGRALRIKFNSSPGKDFYVYGWGLMLAQKGDV